MARSRLLGLAAALLLSSSGAPSGAAAEASRATVLNVTGSGSLSLLLSAWAERFVRRHPLVHIQLAAGGSSTAPPALLQGTAELGPMSRPMTSTERRTFRDRGLVPPLEIQVATDAVAVLVHRNNPVPCLSLADLQGLFGHPGQDGAALPGPWPSGLSPVLYGSTSASGTYAFFKGAALGGRDFSAALQELPGSGGVVHAVGQDPAGIGFASAGYLTAAVRAVPLGAAGRPGCRLPDDPAYPLRRPVFVYVSRGGEGEISKPARTFMRYVLSPEGQATARRLGYQPLSLDERARALRRLEGSP